MANEGKLEGKTIAATYKSLLKLANDSDGGGVAANTNIVSDSLKAIEDGYGNISALAIANDKATLTLGTGSGDDFVVTNSSGSAILTAEGDNSRVGIGIASPSVPLEVFKEQGHDDKDTIIQLNSGTATGNSGLSIDWNEAVAGVYASILGHQATADDEKGTLQFIVSNKAAGGQTAANMYTGTDAVKMVLDEDGMVGIGTATPEYTLELSNSSATNNVPNLAITNLSDTADHEGGNIYFRRGDPSANLTDDDVLGDIVWYGQDNSDDAWIDAGLIRCQINGTPGTNDMPAELQFWTNDGVDSAEQRMCIMADGKVGIGATSPASLLHVSSMTSGDAKIIIESDTDDNEENDNPSLELRQDGAAILGRFALSGDVSDGNHYNNGLDNSTYIESIANDAANTSIQFVTGGDYNAPSLGTARMTISNDGNVGIGTSGPSYKLTVADDKASNYVAHFHNDGANSNRYGIFIAAGEDGAHDAANLATGDIRWLGLGSGTAALQSKIHYNDGGDFATFASGSDERMKDNIADTDVNGLEIINKVKWRKFDWNPTKSAELGYQRKGHEKMWLIAQEVEEFMPNVVSTDADTGCKELGSSWLIKYACKAIQELSAKVTALESA